MCEKTETLHEKKCYKDEKAVIERVLWTKVYVKLHRSVGTQITCSWEHELINRCINLFIKFRIFSLFWHDNDVTIAPICNKSVPILKTVSQFAIISLAPICFKSYPESLCKELPQFVINGPKFVVAAPGKNEPVLISPFEKNVLPGSNWSIGFTVTDERGKILQIVDASPFSNRSSGFPLNNFLP